MFAPKEDNEDVETLLRATFGPPKTGFREFVSRGVVVRRVMEDPNAETERIVRNHPAAVLLSFDDKLTLIRGLVRYDFKARAKASRDERFLARRKYRLRKFGVKRYMALRKAALIAIEGESCVLAKDGKEGKRCS